MFKILEMLKDATLATFDLTEAFLSAGYGASSSKIEFELHKIQKRDADIKSAREKKKMFYDALYRLHRDDLVEKRQRGGRNIWFLTKRGKDKFEKLKERASQSLPKINYIRKAAENELKIIIFDIPEKEKRKRNWLRVNLKILDFKMLQRSVWVGKTKLPEEFIGALKDLKLLSFVEIFTINKRGTLKREP